MSNNVRALNRVTTFVARREAEATRNRDNMNTQLPFSQHSHALTTKLGVDEQERHNKQD